MRAASTPSAASDESLDRGSAGAQKRDPRVAAHEERDASVRMLGSIFSHLDGKIRTANERANRVYDGESEIRRLWSEKSGVRMEVHSLESEIELLTDAAVLQLNRDLEIDRANNADWSTSYYYKALQAGMLAEKYGFYDRWAAGELSENDLAPLRENIAQKQEELARREATYTDAKAQQEAANEAVGQDVRSEEDALAFFSRHASDVLAEYETEDKRQLRRTEGLLRRLRTVAIGKANETQSERLEALSREMSALQGAKFRATGGLERQQADLIEEGIRAVGARIQEEEDEVYAQIFKGTQNAVHFAQLRDERSRLETRLRRSKPLLDETIERAEREDRISRQQRSARWS